MHARITVFLVYMMTSVPLFIMYIIQLTLIVIRPEFASSFYTLFFFAGSVDLLFFSLNVLFYYLPTLPGISQLFAILTPGSVEGRPEYVWVLSVSNTLMYLLPSIQDACNILISLNRFTALILPLAFNRIFTRKLTLIMLPLAVIFSFTACFVTIGAPRSFSDMTPNRSNYEKIYVLHGESKVHFPTIKRSTLVSAHTFACSGICFFTYILAAVQIFRDKVKNLKEIRLLLLGFLILLTNAPSIAYQIYWSVDNTPDLDFSMFLPWVVLIKSLSPPLLMLLINPTMRRRMLLSHSRVFVISSV